MARKGEMIYKQEDGEYQGRYTFSYNENRKTNNEKYELWLYEWLSKKKISVKDSTYIRYCNTVNNHIVPILGK